MQDPSASARIFFLFAFLFPSTVWKQWAVGWDRNRPDGVSLLITIQWLKNKQQSVFLVLEELIKISILNLETGGGIAAKAIELNEN